MKKLKFISILMALALGSSVLLASCNNESSKKEDNIKTVGLKDIMNSDWDDEKTGVISSYSTLNLIGEFSSQSKAPFIITTAEGKVADANKTETKITYIYNANSTGNPIISVSDTQTADNSVNNYVNVISSEYIAILTVTSKNYDYASNYSNYFGAPLSSSYEYALCIQNASGSVVETYYNNEIFALCNNSIYNFDSAYAGSSSDSIIYKYKDATSYVPNIEDGGCDLFTIGSKVYRVNSNLKAELVRDYGIAAMPEIKYMEKVGDYYVSESSTSLYGTDKYIVYNSDLEEVWSYELPSYATGSNEINVLSNGALLVQYLVQLNQDATDYDVMEGATGKYDLVTLLVNKDGTTDLDVNYYIDSVKPSVEGFDGEKVYADDIENLAFIYEITENKRLDASSNNRKFVLMSNDGKITAKVDIGDSVIDYPVQYANGLYMAKLADGTCALYDEDGEKVSTLNDSALKAETISNKYLLLDNAIYDLEGNIVYDANKHHASTISCGNTVIVAKYSATATAYGIFVDGRVINIGTISLLPDTSTIDSFGYHASGYYYTYSNQTKQYTYYNEKGNAIGMFDTLLDFCMQSESFIILRHPENGTMYKLAITK